MKNDHITHEAGNREAWICVCGNTPCDDGFYTCDSLGNEVEPDHHWTTELYVCHQCGRMIHFETLKIMGRNDEIAQAYERRNGTVFA